MGIKSTERRKKKVGHELGHEQIHGTRRPWNCGVGVIVGAGKHMKRSGRIFEEKVLKGERGRVIFIWPP